MTKDKGGGRGKSQLNVVNHTKEDLFSYQKIASRLESSADQQKSFYKHKRSGRPCHGEGGIEPAKGALDPYILSKSIIPISKSSGGSTD